MARLKQEMNEDLSAICSHAVVCTVRTYNVYTVGRKKKKMGWQDAACRRECQRRRPRLSGSLPLSLSLSLSLCVCVCVCVYMSGLKRN